MKLHRLSKRYFLPATIALLLASILIACSGQAQTPTPAPVAQTPTAAPIQLATAAPVEIPEPTEVPAATSVPTEVPPTATTAPPTEAPAPTDTPAPTAKAEMTDPTGMKEQDSLISQLSSEEKSCIAEAGGADLFMSAMDNPELAAPQERDVFINCLEHETLVLLFLKGFTEQTGPLSDNTSACVDSGFQDWDLRTSMLTNTTPGGEAAAMTRGMAGFIIAVSCLNKEEYQAASPGFDLQPGHRESLECITTMLGGPEEIEEIAASLESKKGEPSMAFFNAVSECELEMMGEPPN